MEHFYFLLI